MENNYTIDNGMWLDLEHTNGAITVKNAETDEAFQYGINRNDNSDFNKLFLQMIDEDKIILRENSVALAEKGIIPLQPGWELKDGKIIFIDNEKRKTREVINNRLIELNEEYKTAMSEKNTIYIKNIKRKIENLRNAESLEDYPFIDIMEIEDA